jgi:hypothetical protein
LIRNKFIQSLGASLLVSLLLFVSQQLVYEVEESAEGREVAQEELREGTEFGSVLLFSGFDSIGSIPAFSKLISFVIEGSFRSTESVEADTAGISLYILYCCSKTEFS